MLYALAHTYTSAAAYQLFQSKYSKEKEEKLMKNKENNEEQQQQQISPSDVSLNIGHDEMSKWRVDIENSGDLIDISDKMFKARSALMKTLPIMAKCPTYFHSHPALIPPLLARACTMLQEVNNNDNGGGSGGSDDEAEKKEEEISKMEEVKKCMKEALKVHHTAYGGGVELFALRYGTLTRDLVVARYLQQQQQQQQQQVVNESHDVINRQLNEFLERSPKNNPYLHVDRLIGMFLYA
jgi:hypothetical protein